MPFLTPNAPGGIKYLTLQIPDTMIPSLMGSLLDLDSPDNWDVFGALTVQETVDLIGGMFASLLIGDTPPTGEGNMYRTFVYILDGVGDFLFVVDNLGNPIFVLQANEVL